MVVFYVEVFIFVIHGGTFSNPATPCILPLCKVLHLLILRGPVALLGFCQDWRGGRLGLLAPLGLLALLAQLGLLALLWLLALLGLLAQLALPMRGHSVVM